MTLEKLRKLIYDIFAYETEGESSELYTEAFDLLESSMIIPKPKFNASDKVKPKNGRVATINIFEGLDLGDGWIYQVYDPTDNKWGYFAFEDYVWLFYDESELELMEKKK